jgi:hypothetical protein
VENYRYHTVARNKRAGYRRREAEKNTNFRRREAEKNTNFRPDVG